MPIIAISDISFAELKSLAEPFVDTPESLTARLIHEEAVRRGIQSDEKRDATPVEDGAVRQNPVSHENLAHTRLISATVGGRELFRPKWNGLMNHLHVLALERLGSFDALRKVSGARLRPGRSEEEGFKYLPGADLSIQGVEANVAWDHSFILAESVGIPIKVVFEWRDKEGALHPGKRGVLEWNSAPTAHIRTPRLANAQQAGDFRKTIVEVAADAQI